MTAPRGKRLTTCTHNNMNNVHINNNIITKMNLKDLVSVEKSLIARIVATMIQSLTHACNW